ncbi:hypothetical protein SEUCBS139899_006466 [Sporothrix eucalyptigena]|uniref:Uncharacterized protein n=1 Tax=Sporothrix eucalyptigena TaxID=1812306 RepID=A0ABP0CK63_9PEZI
MSGSGGFYKYRCKYFLTHDCPNWVFVNYAPCADCCAAGRDMDNLGEDPSASHHPFLYGASPEFEIGVPIFQDGILRYTFAGMASSYEPSADFASWMTLRPPLLDGSMALPSPYPPPPPQSPHHLQQRQQPPHHLQQQPLHLQMQQQPLPPYLAHPGQQHLQHTFVQEQPAIPPHLQQHQAALKLQGSSPARQGVKMQLPPHAASKAFPASTAAGVGDMLPAGTPGMSVF